MRRFSKKLVEPEFIHKCRGDYTPSDCNGCPTEEVCREETKEAQGKPGCFAEINTRYNPDVDCAGTCAWETECTDMFI